MSLVWLTEILETFPQAFWFEKSRIKENGGKILANSREKIQSCFYPGDVVTCMGDREIRSVSGRLPDNPGELAYMPLHLGYCLPVLLPQSQNEKESQAMYIAFWRTIEFNSTTGFSNPRCSVNVAFTWMVRFKGAVSHFYHDFERAKNTAGSYITQQRWF